MNKKVWMFLMLGLVITGLMFTSACSKKQVKADDSIQQDTSAADKAKMDEEARKRAEDERLRKLAEEERLRKLNEGKGQVGGTIETIIAERIYFEYDRADLKPEAQEILKKKAEAIMKSGGSAITIEGNCDERGTNEYNMALGERRAKSARDFLVKLGVPANKLKIISYGEERPAADCHDDNCWSKNRRDEFVTK